MLRTDHAALMHLMRTPNPVAQSTLAEYQFAVRYRPGDSHRNADALSRRLCGRERNAPLCRQCVPMLDPVAEDPDAQEASVKTDDHGRGFEAAGLHSGLDSVQADSDSKPSLAKVTLRIPGRFPGASGLRRKLRKSLSLWKQSYMYVGQEGLHPQTLWLIMCN